MSERDEPTIEQLNDEADIAADYLEGLLDIADYDGDIEMGVRNGRAMVQIVADDNSDIKSLTGKNGEVVEALQRLTRLAVQEKTGERSHLILDVDGYLKHKREGLHAQAMNAVEEARETGEPVDLAPMNSFERKIVHDVVRDEGLKSRSHGEEPHRYVTVYVRSKATAPAGEDLDDSADDDADIAENGVEEIIEIDADEIDEVVEVDDESDESDDDFDDADDDTDSDDDDFDDDDLEEDDDDSDNE
jgi:spoIIIJ-associated protein